MAFDRTKIYYVENLEQRRQFEVYAEEMTNIGKIALDGTIGIILLSSGNTCIVRKGIENTPLYALTRDENGVIMEYTEYPTTEIPFVWPNDLTLREAVTLTNTTGYSLQILGFYCFE